MRTRRLAPSALFFLALFLAPALAAAEIKIGVVDI